jgi:hypothetical protein
MAKDLTISQRATAVAPANMPAGFAVKKQVTRSVLQQKDGEVFYVTIEAPAYQGQEITMDGRSGKPKMAPARLCEVVNLSTGELQLLIMNTVLESELARAYPPSVEGGDPTYSGHSFAILRAHPAEADKRYKTYKILEIEPVESGNFGSAGKGVIDGTTKEAVDAAKARK